MYKRQNTAILVKFFVDVVEVECGQDAITAKIQKEVVTSSGYEKEDIHLNDNSCLFDGEDGEFFVSVISPLTACETYFTVRFVNM